MSATTAPIAAGIKRCVLLVPASDEAGQIIHESQLLDMLSNNAVRQLCIYQSAAGYVVKALPTWKNEFVTLVGYKTKAPRRYKRLGRIRLFFTRIPADPRVLASGDTLAG